MNINLTTKKREAVVASLAENPGAVLERIAEQHGITPANVLACLPAGEALTIQGDAFEQVMQEIASWGEVTFVVHTPDVILEARGKLPAGEMSHGYYNLHGKPIGGHLKADHCAAISFVSRKLFSNDTHSVQFYNIDGGCMFKIYLGRDQKHQLIPAQVAKFKSARDRMLANK